MSQSVAPTTSGPYTVIRQAFEVAFGQLEALGKRMSAMEASRADRSIADYHLDGANRLVITLADGTREIAGKVMP